MGPHDCSEHSDCLDKGPCGTPVPKQKSAIQLAPKVSPLRPGERGEFGHGRMPPKANLHLLRRAHRDNKRSRPAKGPIRQAAPKLVMVPCCDQCRDSQSLYSSPGSLARSCLPLSLRLLFAFAMTLFRQSSSEPTTSSTSKSWTPPSSREKLSIRFFIICTSRRSLVPLNAGYA